MRQIKGTRRDRFLHLVKVGGIGKFGHRREPTSVDKQDVIRMNRDTLYSFAVFDLDAGPVTITLPDAGKRFMSLGRKFSTARGSFPIRNRSSRRVQGGP